MGHITGHESIACVTMHRKPTLQQVAVRAGVSRSTAGAALAGSSRVAKPTADKVRDAAISLGYRTEPHARLLRRGGPELANLVLDMRLTHTEDGAMHPFWARLLTGFVARLQQNNWLCIVQFQHPEAPVLSVPAPAAILATNDAGVVSLFVSDTFGQTVLSLVDTNSQDGPRLALQHDYEAIGTGCARYFASAGCRHVLLVGRSHFAYSDAILAFCTRELRRLGLAVHVADDDGSVAERIARELRDDIDGVLDLTARPVDLALALRSRPAVRSEPTGGEIVVVTNADGADRTDRSGFARLSLEGHPSGCLAADFFVKVMEHRTIEHSPMLPFVIHHPEA